MFTLPNKTNSHFFFHMFFIGLDLFGWIYKFVQHILTTVKIQKIAMGVMQADSPHQHNGNFHKRPLWRNGDLEILGELGRVCCEKGESAEISSPTLVNALVFPRNINYGAQALKFWISNKRSSSQKHVFF